AGRDDALGHRLAEGAHDGIMDPAGRAHPGLHGGRWARVEDRAVGDRYPDRAVAALVKGDVVVMQHAADRALDGRDGRGVRAVDVGRDLRPAAREIDVDAAVAHFDPRPDRHWRQSPGARFDFVLAVVDTVRDAADAGADARFGVVLDGGHDVAHQRRAVAGRQLVDAPLGGVVG